LTWQ